MSSDVEADFQDLRKELTDPDPIVRGVAAVDLGSFALEYPEYKEQVIFILEKALNDPDPEVRDSVQKSLDQIAGKEFIDPGKQVIGFGYLPDEYRQQQPEMNTKTLILNCVCCIILITTVVLIFVL